MPVTVTANSPMSVSHQGSTGVSIAFPDVCKTPTPGGPVPIPYPNVAQSADTSDGSSSVKMDGKPVMLKKSNFKMSTGDEAGSAMGVVSNKIKGKLKFVNYSFDVKVEGQNVCRLADPSQQNMGSANTVGPFHAQAPVPPGMGTAEACQSTQDEVKKQEKAGKEAQWGKSGVIKKHRTAFQFCADKFGYIIYIRQTNPLCAEWIEESHMPKPHAWVKAKTISPANEHLIADWLAAEKKRAEEHGGLPPAPTTKGRMKKSNLLYSWSSKDYYGLVLSLKDASKGQPLRGLEEGKCAERDAGISYQTKWMTGDYDLMDVMANDNGCHRLKDPSGVAFGRLKVTLNKRMKWDGIQHGPQAQWVPRKEKGDYVDDSFPDRITGWLASGSPTPPKVPIGGGRELPAYDQNLTVVAPKKTVYLETTAQARDALLCCGCANPGEEVD